MEDIVITIVSRLFVFGWITGPLLAMAGRKVGPQSLLNIAAIPVLIVPAVLLALCGSVVVIRDAWTNEDVTVWLNYTGAGAFIIVASVSALIGYAFTVHAIKARSQGKYLWEIDINWSNMW